MDLNNLPHIMSRVLNQPLLMEPAYSRTFFSALASRIGIRHLTDINGDVEASDKLRVRADAYQRNETRERTYRVIDGVAVLPITGTLVNKYGFVQPRSGMTGYDGILARAAQAFEDDGVKGVLLDMDTPGGDVAGCFDCVKSLRALADSSEKPLWAIASDMYCSAGMALASAADKRLITSTAVVGSIGVLMAHANYEKQLEENGIDVTLIHAGAHKVDGNPYQALSEDVYNEFLANTESLRQEFAELVAQNMNLSVEKVLATEARTYRGEEAIQIGLADQLVNSNEAIQIFSEYLSTQGSTTFTGASMSQDATKAPKQDDPAATDPATDTGAQAQDTSTDLRAEERARIGAIIGSEEAKGREGLANHLATNTDLSVEAALGVLSAAATEQQATNNLDGVMSEQSPSIGADTSADDDQTQEQKDANAIAGSFKKIKGN